MLTRLPGLALKALVTVNASMMSGAWPAYLFTRDPQGDEKITPLGMQVCGAGIGYGGSCFPKDVSALNKIAEEYKYDFNTLKSVMKVNEEQKRSLVRKLKTYFKNDLKGKRIALWGLAFKPDTDDIREAPSLYIIEELLKEGAVVSAFDPAAISNVKRIFSDKVTFGKDEYEILNDADALIIATEWSLFRTPDFEKIKSLMQNKVIFDGRNLYDLSQMKEMGFHYNSVGREIIN